MISPEALAKLEEAILGARAHLTDNDVEALSGVDEQTANRLWRALGFPDSGDGEVAFTEADVDALKATKKLLENDMLSVDASVMVTRAMGQAMSHLAEAQMDIAADRLAQIPGINDIARDNPDQLIDLALGSSAVLRQPLEQILIYVYRRHLLAAAQRYLAAATSALSEGTSSLVVGFCDITGFTSHTREMSQEELGTLISTFESTAFDIVVQGGGRVVKTLGDSVMLVADDPVKGVLIGLHLAEAFEDETLGVPPVHVGMAYGPALTRAGDVFGAAVNIASRATSVARPNTVVVDRGLAEALADLPEFTIRRLRPQRVRGYENLQVAVVRFAEDPTADQATRDARKLARIQERTERALARAERAIEKTLHPDVHRASTSSE